MKILEIPVIPGKLACASTCMRHQTCPTQQVEQGVIIIARIVYCTVGCWKRRLFCIKLSKVPVAEIATVHFYACLSCFIIFCFHPMHANEIEPKSGYNQKK